MTSVSFMAVMAWCRCLTTAVSLQFASACNKCIFVGRTTLQEI